MADVIEAGMLTTGDRFRLLFSELEFVCLGYCPHTDMMLYRPISSDAVKYLHPFREVLVDKYYY